MQVRHGGTFGYMTPEGLNGTATDARADVYSLTCVLYELLVGQRLSARHASTPSLIEAHLHEPPPVVSRFNLAVPPGFDQVVARGMAKDPAQRYPSVAALLTDVQHVVGQKSDRTSSETDQIISFAAQPATGDRPAGVALDGGGSRQRAGSTLTRMAAHRIAGSYWSVSAPRPPCGSAPTPTPKTALQQACRQRGLHHRRPWLHRPLRRPRTRAPALRPVQCSATRSA
jgi:serine/threonine protein kinase